MQRLWLISYDISDDRQRRAVEAELLSVGERVQWSVFEAFLTPARQRQLQQQLDACIDPDSDSLRWYPLCRWCQQRVTLIGQGRRSDDPWLLLV